jgi:SIR2-like domain/CHAT domain
MADTYEESLRKAIAAGEAVVVVGAGVSIAATKLDDGTAEPCASWAGLLADGLQRMRDHGADANRVTAVSALLDGGDYEAAAGLIRKALGENDVAAWLRERFDTFAVRRPAVPRALGRLGVPLLTTNYDHVLEQATERGWRTWDEPEAWQELRDQPTRDVLHVHGSYRRPGSVVLDQRSYDRVIADKPSQHFWRALATTHSLVFVGFGKGYDDANFSQLRAFLAGVLQGVNRRHYRLMPQEEIVPGTEAELHENVKPVGFPGGFDGLAAFLESLAPPSAQAAAPAAPKPPPPRVFEVTVGMNGLSAVVREGDDDVDAADDHRRLDPVDVETVQLLDAWLRESEPAVQEREARADLVLTRRRVQRQIGRILFAAVFGGQVGRLYQDRRKRTDEPFSLVLRILPERLVLPDEESSVNLRDLPWELLWDERGYLSSVSNLPLLRADTQRGASTWKPAQRLKVLVVLAQPASLLEVARVGWPQDEYDAAIRGIVEAIGPGNDAAGTTGDAPSEPPTPTVLDVVHLPGGPENPAAPLGTPLCWSDVVKTVRGENEDAVADEVKPFDVLHFIGHGAAGDNEVEIAFSTPDGGIEWIGGGRVADELFENLDDERKPTLVFLHLCGGPPTFPDPRGERNLSRASFNLLAYRLLRLSIPVVVAMQYPIRPDAGQVFTAKFYEQVKTKTIARAVQGARAELLRKGHPLGPVLFMSGDDRPMLVGLEVGPSPARAGTAAERSRPLTPPRQLPGQPPPRDRTGGQPGRFGVGDV